MQTHTLHRSHAEALVAAASFGRYCCLRRNANPIAGPVSPLQRYRQDLERPEFCHDPAQEAVVHLLQRVHQELLDARPPSATATGLLGRLRRHLAGTPMAQQPAVKGLYLWGGVGRGKTYLVDTFFDGLPIERKKRIHFHRFMQKVHHGLRDLKQQQDPLRIVARGFASNARVICFDEFFVSDITDAMLLAGLLRGLFDHGVTLVATSNVAPDRLYWDGLQRARFLPAIELIKSHMEVFHMAGELDYRLRQLEQAELYHHPLDEAADGILLRAFEAVAPEPGREGIELEIEGRSLPTRRYADGVVWFDFETLCGGPRSTADYIEIARCFHTVFVSGLPIMDANREDEARRFLNLVDEFYDRNVKLVMSGETALEQVYAGKRLAFEYQRAVSRLKEMQSHDYLARPHLP